MTAKVITRQRITAVKAKRVTVGGLEKKPQVKSAAALVLAGTTVLRRRKAAETLAAILKVDLFRVDLSAVVSQHNSETEKNLNAVFAKAAASGAILFFDEADRLFEGSSNVQSAHRKAWSPEVTHLLKRVERHNGLVILTTDGRHDIEEAFSSVTQAVVLTGTTAAVGLKKQ